MAGQDWIEKDFYRVLGVPKDADQKTIKKAYRRLARKYHPDQNKGNPRAEAQFKRVGEAYQVLSHPQQRKQYDALRAMAGGGPRFTAGPGGAGANGFEDVFASMYGAGRGGAGSGGNSANYRFYQSGGASDFSDILSGIFGGQGGSPYQGHADSSFGFGSAMPPQRGQDLAASTSLTFGQAVQGATLKLSVEGRTMTVRVPAGVHDGQKIRLKGKGRPSPRGGEPGDLVVTLHVSAHPVLSVKDNALHMVLPISVDEAIHGATVAVPLLDGSSVHVKIPAGTSSDTIMRVKGKGLPRTRGRAGDLYIRTRIVVPRAPSEAMKKAAAKVHDAMDFDPRAEFRRHMAQ